MKVEKVFIATPTAGGVVATAFTSTLVAITITLKKQGINYCYCTIDSSDIVTARNYLANSFIRDKSCSHILFVDSDMAVPQETLSAMLASGKDFVGTIYPERQLSLERYGTFLKKGYEHEEALASALKYNVRHLSKDVEIVGNLCKVRGLGFGFVLIARSIFDNLIAQNGVLSMESSVLKKFNLTGNVFDFFSELPVVSGERLSEDYSFCERVIRSKAGEIWAVVAEKVGHVGKFTYGSPYIVRLKVEQAEPRKATAAE